VNRDNITLLFSFSFSFSFFAPFKETSVRKTYNRFYPNREEIQRLNFPEYQTIFTHNIIKKKKKKKAEPTSPNIQFNESGAAKYKNADNRERLGNDRLRF
jgi:hypothetical protein